MGDPPPETKRPLRLLHAAHALVQQDPVESWQAAVRARLRDAQKASPQPELRLDVSLGFVLFASAVGSAGGMSGSAELFVVATSVLLSHELARAALARSLGRPCRISLSITGAQTEISGPKLERGAAIGVATIGSFLNALLAVTAQLAVRYVAAPRALHLLHELFWAHIVWAAAQPLPLLPFRAGLAIARRLSVRQRRIHAIGSALFAMNFAIWMLGFTGASAVLVVLGCATFAALKTSREALLEILDQRASVEAMTAEARALLASGNSRRAAALARGALDAARSSVQRQALWTTLAWAGIAERDPFLSHTALLNLPADAIDVYLLASYLNACNRLDEALDLLREARRLGAFSVETSKLLIDLLFVRGDHAGARAIAESDAAVLSAEDRLAIDAALS